jgi:hypothetical protein
MRRLWLPLVLPLALTACAADVPTEDDPLGDVLDDGKADSSRSPTLHDDLFFDVIAKATLARGTRYHAWDFALDGDARVTFTTFADDWTKDIDTAVYLYADRDGAWTLVSRSTTGAHDEKAAQLTADVGQGAYRVVVKGQTSRIKGDFGLLATCAGDACPTAIGSCLFGDAGSKLERLPDSYVTIARAPGTPEDVDPSAEAVRQQRLEILAQAAGFEGDAPAITAVREGMLEDLMGRSFLFYRFELDGKAEQVAGLFPAILDEPSDPSAVWRGDERLDCLQPVPVCVFGSSMASLDRTTAPLERRTLDASAQLSDQDADQLAIAYQLLGTEGAAELSELSAADDHPYTLIAFGEKHGVVFDFNTTTPVALVVDGDVVRCDAYHDAARF